MPALRPPRGRSWEAAAVSGGPRRRRLAGGAILVLLLVLLPALALEPQAVPRSPTTLASSAPPSEHPTRVKILAYVEAVPGAHFRSIARGVSVSRSEARHHLNVLMRRGEVREVRHAGRLRYYVNHRVAADRNATFGAYWEMQECRVRVLRFVRDRTVAGPSDVAVGLGISRQLAGYHLRRLAASGLLVRAGGSYRA